MSHRKFVVNHPCFSGFYPKKHVRRHRGRVKSFPKDDPSKPIYLGASITFKTGVTCVVREIDHPFSRNGHFYFLRLYAYYCVRRVPTYFCVRRVYRRLFSRLQVQCGDVSFARTLISERRVTSEK